MVKVKEYVQKATNFSEDEKQQIYNDLEQNDIGRLAKLIMILMSWSIVAFFVESALIGGGVVFSIIKGIDWRYFLPELVFVAGNFIAKIYFIKWYMKDTLSFTSILYASVPTIGPGILLGIVVKNNSLLMKVLRGYMNYRKKSFFERLKK